jgi:hypothetical protein
VNGNDKILPVEIEDIDNSTTDRASSVVEWIIEANRVIRRTTITDLPFETPQTVSMAQARLALIGAGLFSAIDAGLKSLPEPQRTTALTAWEYAPNVSRNGTLVTTLASQFGLTKKQLDNLFFAAAAIEL